MRSATPGSIVLALLCAVTLSGCTQVAAIAPVGGDHLAEVRYAAIDVLLTEGIEILVAPVCTVQKDGGVSCVGSTMDDDDITVRSTADNQAWVTVIVGEDEIYAGSIADVIDDAARSGS